MARLALGVRSAASPGTLRAAIAGGAVHLGVLLVTWTWAYGPPTQAWRLLFSAQVGPWLWWAIAGSALVGAVVAVALVGYGLVSPLAGTALIYGSMLYEMWRALQAPAPLLPGTPFDLYLVGWPVVLGLAVALALAERRIRGRRWGNGGPGTT